MIRRSIFFILAALMVSLSLAGKALASTLDADISNSDIRMPTPMKAGQKYDIVVKVTNVGQLRWQGKDFQLLTKITKSPSGAPAQREDFTPHVYLKDSVETRQKTEFHYKVEAPTWTGDWELEISMAKGNNRFGDRIKKKIRVVGD